MLATSVITACGNGSAEPTNNTGTDSNATTNEQTDKKADMTDNLNANPQELTPESVDEFELVRLAAHDYVQLPVHLLSTEEVYQTFVVGDGAGWQLISTRTEADYNAGHIIGAERIHRVEFAKPETLNMLEKDKKIMLYCYSASGATYVSAMLNLMGYDAYGMAIGMTEWTNNREVAATDLMPVAIENYPVTTEALRVTETYELPRLKTGYTEAADIVFAMGSDYFASGQARWIGAWDVWALLDSKELTELYTLIDVREPELYAIGHVPGAINIPYQQTMDVANLQKLPVDKPQIIISTDGQKATQIAAIYNLLGYDARTMLFGMMSWTNDTEILGRQLWQGPNDYPYVSNN